ncbi:zinc finger CW-type PWWP domain protein 2 homolog [Saccostrea cucullata]|uniref:zinc finger CW-type PWWP domain protein 2 homolog n=1 Tax=Saccostrea cuccullata TaxID=36930 RepID=UPI002ED0DA41
MNSSVSSSPTSQRTALQEVDMLERIRQVKNFTWIQCDNVNCQKWRKIPSTEGESLEDIEWFCHMNSDPKYNSCEAVEEDYTAYDRLAKKLGFKYIMSCLSVGTLVWAKTSGYCRWPAIITNDPEYDFHYEVDRDGDPFRYHVEYLGGVHCHAWIPANKVTLYGHKEEIQQEQGTSLVKNMKNVRKNKKKRKRLRLAMHTKCSKLENYRKSSVTEAIQEADLLIPLTSEERINTACKFKGSNQKQRIWKNQSDGADDDNSKSALGLKNQLYYCESKRKRKQEQTYERKHRRLQALSQSQSHDKGSRGEDSKDPCLKGEFQRENSNSDKTATHFPLRTDVNTIQSPSCSEYLHF